MDYYKKKHYVASKLYNATVELIKFNKPFAETFTPVFEEIKKTSDYLPLLIAFDVCYELIDTFRNRAHDNSKKGSCSEAEQINSFYDAKINEIDICRNLVVEKIKEHNLI